MPKEIISRSDLKFWIPIIGIIITGVIAFKNLEGQAQAIGKSNEDMIKREQINKGQFGELINEVIEMGKTLVKIETNQEHIMRELNIEVE